MEPEFLKFIKDDKTYLEREPLEKATTQRQLVAFKHKGFWQCMDTLRDKTYLEELWAQPDCPWRQVYAKPRRIVEAVTVGEPVNTVPFEPRMRQVAS